jgi:hypothetical protein
MQLSARIYLGCTCLSDLRALRRRGTSSNFRAAFARRLGRVRAPHANRARGGPKTKFISDGAC